MATNQNLHFLFHLTAIIDIPLYVKFGMVVNHKHTYKSHATINNYGGGGGGVCI
jgi:hypothetical protein